MGKLSDIQIKTWLRSQERFEGRSDGNGLYLCYRKEFSIPKWRFRYSYGGKARAMWIGSYGDLSLAKARERARELSARVALGYDVAGEKQERKASTLAKIEKEKNARRVSDLALEYYGKQIVGRWKHPDILRRRIEKDIKPHIGNIKVEDVTPGDIDRMLQSIVQRGAPTIANDVLRWIKRIFNYGIKRHYLSVNPAAAFDNNDAGGQEKSRDRFLSEEEITLLFRAMKIAKGFSRQNEITFKLLLILCCRKMELCAARWEDFDLDAGIWHLKNTKNGDNLDIPLSSLAIKWLQELKDLSLNSDWVLPARKIQNRMIPHIAESTLPVALAKLKPHMGNIENFTIHDFRRTARSYLASLGVDPVVAERCLNHRIKGVEGIYNRHHYFDERKIAMQKLSDFFAKFEEKS
ncbi:MULTISPECIES: tyrosine-type recombinase/integrase [Enterobacter cloacae complex]|uniref:tyrosine-type recombinase/integrase n=1 Tax=Enterobacter cloacae complex TaxID=354276 RepID=UPI0032AF86A5|nr:tyrosine-type recombinase/integrase [Klebsiella variicola subsp. variicola]